jgi:Ser/Thr protein kinase RdoA (MazF antagonist)
MWDTIHGGFQKEITPITIPMTPESFGAIHSDLHPGNFLIDTENAMSMSILDFDGA